MVYIVPTFLESIKKDPGAVADANANVFLGKCTPLSNFFSCSINININNYCPASKHMNKLIFAGNTEAAEAPRKKSIQ